MSSKTSNKEPSNFWRALLIQLVLIFLVYLVVQAWHGRSVPRGFAPLIQGQLLDGRHVNLADYRGQPVLIHFWASWCSVCRFEEDSIKSIAKDYVVISIASQSGDADKVRAYVVENELSIPVLVDEDGFWGQLYGVRAFPSSYIIDNEGLISDVEIGYSSEWGLRARLFWAGY